MINKSFFTFLFVGVLNTVVGLSCIYIFLNVFHWDYWISTFVGNTVGACISYLLNKRFTFKSDARIATSVIRFLFVILLSYLIAYKVGLEIVELVAYQMNSLQEYVDEFAVLLGSGFYTLLNYFGQKYYVFPRREEKTGALNE